MRKQVETKDIQEWSLIGQQIRESRKKRRLTQSRLAEMVGVSDDTIGRLERGKANDVPFLLICRIGRALEISLECLCPEVMLKNELRTADPEKASHNVERLYEIVKEMELLITKGE